MRGFRTFVITLALGSVMCAASAQTTYPPKEKREEVPFRIVSAVVQQFEKAQPSRKGAYREALVLRIEAAVADYEALPPSIEAYLYIGTHEMKPLRFEWGQERVVVTFHDPDWRSLRGGEPMVLTIRQGEPIRNRGKYENYPKFDVSVIGRR